MIASISSIVNLLWFIIKLVWFATVFGFCLWLIWKILCQQSFKVSLYLLCQSSLIFIKDTILFLFIHFMSIPFLFFPSCHFLLGLCIAIEAGVLSELQLYLFFHSIFFFVFLTGNSYYCCSVPLLYLIWEIGYYLLDI